MANDPGLPFVVRHGRRSKAQWKLYKRFDVAIEPRLHEEGR